MQKHTNLKEIFSKLFHTQSSVTLPLICAMFGAIGALLFGIKLICSENLNNVEFTKDDWIYLTASVFTFTMFLPLTAACLVGYLSCKAIEKQDKRLEELEKAIEEK